MSGLGDVQPSGGVTWFPQPAIWAQVEAGNNITFFSIPDFFMMRIHMLALTIQYRWEDQMTEAEIQYGGATNRGVILAIGALSPAAFTEFIYQQRYYVATETEMDIAHGDAAYFFTLNSSSVNPLGGISMCQAFMSYSLAYGPPGTF